MMILYDVTWEEFETIKKVLIAENVKGFDALHKIPKKALNIEVYLSKEQFKKIYSIIYRFEGKVLDVKISEWSAERNKELLDWDSSMFPKLLTKLKKAFYKNFKETIKGW